MGRVEESQTKIEAVRRWLADGPHAGLLLESQVNFGWITAGGESQVVTSEEKGAAAVLITRSRACVITTNIEAGRLADEQLPDGCFEVLAYPWSSPERRDEMIEDLAGGGPVAGDLPGERPAAGLELTELRRVLVAGEIDRYRSLGEEAALVLESVCRSVARRDPELDVAARVAELCYEKGIVPAVNLVAADDRFEKYRHPLPTARRVERKFMVVLTGRRGGLHASLTRTVCFGEPDAEQERRHLACARIDALLIRSSRPGCSLSEVLARGIEQYATEGFADEWKHHHQGGLTGYAGRELLATPKEHYIIRSNQAFAWNPSVSGAKSEDTILVTDGGQEILTSTGHWPEAEIELDGEVTGRPGLLVR